MTRLGRKKESIDDVRMNVHDLGLIVGCQVAFDSPAVRQVCRIQLLPQSAHAIRRLRL